MLAAASSGLHQDLATARSRMAPTLDEITPDADWVRRYDQLYARWATEQRHALAQTLGVGERTMHIASRLPLDNVLKTAVSAAKLPGVVAVVATVDDLLYETALGVRDVDSGAPMTIDTIFGIASMTKTVTAIAVLQLAESGLLSLDQPTGDILPAFDDLPVLSGFSGGTPITRPPTRRATVRDLLANVSGLGYDTWNKDLWCYHSITGIPNISAGSRRTFAIPLIADPGTRFSYGTGFDWAGLIVEQVAGQTLDSYFRDRITGPLGMPDTDVQMSPEQRARAAAVHVPGPDGGWTVQAPAQQSSPEFYAGGHCLSSTPADYLRLQRALLSGGALDGIRILSPVSVREMLSNQIGSLSPESAETCNAALSEGLRFPPHNKWGLGVAVTQVGEDGLRSCGSAGWAGVFNTLYWLDPVKGVTAALYAQTLPFLDSAIFQVYTDFERALYAVLTD
jgi:methyl acetate hydrolase